MTAGKYHQNIVGLIAADPNFGTASAAYIQAYVAWRRTLRQFNKIISSELRRRLMKSILYLHFSNRTSEPNRGATLSAYWTSWSLLIATTPSPPYDYRTGAAFRLPRRRARVD